MKKYIKEIRTAVLLCTLTAAILLSFAACGGQAEPEVYFEQPLVTEDGSSSTGETAGTSEESPAAQVANPVVEYSSMGEINAAVGTKLCTLEISTSSGSSASSGSGTESPAVICDESFTVINKETAQYKCTRNGVPFTYRANPYTYEDICGIYQNGGLVFGSFHPGNDEPFCYRCTDQYKIARWFTSSQVQYVLTAEDSGSLSEEEFLALAEECRKTTGLMKDSAYYDNLAGDYYESKSSNATMEVVSCGWEGVMITILWNDSAAAKDCWTMDARIDDETGLLVYTGGLHELITFAEDGSETRETIAGNLSGSFTYDEETGHILWTGGEEGFEDAEFTAY